MKHAVSAKCHARYGRDEEDHVEELDFSTRHRKGPARMRSLGSSGPLQQGYHLAISPVLGDF
jgi:hypothetical protein